MLKSPHSCVLCTVIAASLLLGTVPAWAASATFDAGDGVHPYDLLGRTVARGSNRDDHRETDYRALYDFYYFSPHRAQSRSLHPFFRYRYWDDTAVTFVTSGKYGRTPAMLAYEYDARTRNWVPATSQGLAMRKGACDNYAFVRPNPRTPTFGYECIDDTNILQRAAERAEQRVRAAERDRRLAARVLR